MFNGMIDRRPLAIVRCHEASDVARGIAYNAMGKAEANMGIAIGDVDGDGLFDVFVTHLTDETNTLWKQGPRGIFQDCTVGLGLAGPRWRGTGFGTVMPNSWLRPRAIALSDS